MTRLLVVAWLTLVWVMLWGSPSPANLAGGVAVAALVTGGFPVGRAGRPGVHPVAIARFGAWFAGALVVATCRVAVLAVRPRVDLDQSVVPVRLRATSVLVTAFVANSISLTPGTLTVEVVPDDDADDVGPRSLLIHSLDTSDVAAVRRDCAAIESLVVAAFGTEEDRRRLADAADVGEERNP